MRIRTVKTHKVVGRLMLWVWFQGREPRLTIWGHSFQLCMHWGSLPEPLFFLNVHTYKYPPKLLRSRVCGDRSDKFLVRDFLIIFHIRMIYRNSVLVTDMHEGERG